MANMHLSHSISCKCTQAKTCIRYDCNEKFHAKQKQPLGATASGAWYKVNANKAIFYSVVCVWGGSATGHSSHSFVFVLFTQYLFHFITHRRAVLPLASVLARFNPSIHFVCAPSTRARRDVYSKIRHHVTNKTITLKHIDQPNAMRHHYMQPNAPNKELLIATYQLASASQYPPTNHSEIADEAQHFVPLKQKRSHNNEKQISKNVSMVLEDLLK